MTTELVDAAGGAGPLDEMEERKRKALLVASRISSSVLGKHPRAAPSDACSKKIVVPQDDSDFNYLGMLIGPRGSTQQSLEMESGCRVFFRGRGSSKDGNDEDPNEPLYVLIEGASQEAVGIAERMVNNILFNREEQARIKGNQLRTVAEQKNTNTLVLSDRMYAQDLNYLPMRAHGDTNKVLTIPAGQVGQIIGKGGETIKMLQSRTGCFIQVSRDIDMATNMKTVTLDGSVDQVAHAEDEITRILHENEARTQARMSQTFSGDAIPASGLVGASAGLGYGGMQPFVMPVPNDCVGMIIGKGGVTIKQMQYRTGCTIQVQRDLDSDPMSRTRDITLSGNEMQIEDAKREIGMLLQSLQDTSHGGGDPMGGGMMGMGGAPPGVSVETMFIPGQTVGAVIGRQGDMIKAIQHRSGTRVQISRDVTQIEREITLTGSLEGIVVARNEILSIVADQQRMDSERESGRRPTRDPMSHGGGSYQQDPYQSQAANYGSEVWMQQQAQAAYYDPSQQQYYDYQAYGAQQPQYQQQAYGPAGAVVPGAPQGDAGTPDTAVDTSSMTEEQKRLEEWNTYCHQYFAYYGQYPAEAYADPAASANAPNERIDQQQAQPQASSEDNPGYGQEQADTSDNELPDEDQTSAYQASSGAPDASGLSDSYPAPDQKEQQEDASTGNVEEMRRTTRSRG